MAQKFGTKVPKTVDEALILDKEMRNVLWSKARQKEMRVGKKAFNILNDDERPPNGPQNMKCQMDFSIKMENFQEMHAQLQEALWLKPLRV